MKVGLAQIRPKLGRVDENLRLHQELIRRATSEQVDLLVFPELSVTGYQLQDLTLDVGRPVTDEHIQTLLRESEEMDLVFGFVEESEDHIFYNAALYASGGEVQYLHRKVYLPTYGMFDEGRYFGRGNSIRSFQTRFGRTGILICEDVWHPSTSYLMAQDGAKVLIVVSNAPVKGVPAADHGNKKVWYDILTNIAVLHGMYVVYVNRVGTEDGVSFFGGSTVIDPFGWVQDEAPLFEETLLTVDLDLEKVRRARYQNPVLRDEDLDLTVRELNRIREKRRGGDSR
ncbi:carbon-nitrogen hydrolase [Marinithermofilum abyssi]|uniref:Carbon-nitrogen hydrolase n=1 Tax=Marinithermofilum abyssi TaxID=1571185 RepID=A0A8J2YCT9_9BACL|nr:nitrilase-related carbon-nitrogen hydrolase [Marinithermofilum abyssi]GGE18848.1 carbon-nitrogen hydrolase [Marinithermofilum abyssi]